MIYFRNDISSITFRPACISTAYDVVELYGFSFDLVQRPIESTTTIHVLPPRSLFLHQRCALLIAGHLLPLGSAKSSETHHLSHGFFVRINTIHWLGFLAFLKVWVGLRLLWRILGTWFPPRL